MNSSPTGVSVIVPAHNEAGAIATVLDELDRALAASGRAYEIVVVDDGSSDGTDDRVDAARFTLVRHDANRGYGAAIKTGARHARHDLLAIVDADGTYPVARLGELIEAADEFDMAVGARTGAHVDIPLVRRPAKWAITRLANYLSGRRIPDINSGLRVMRRELFERFVNLLPDGFSLTTTITLAALTNGHRVQYLPIDYRRRTGRSKIRPLRDTFNFVSLILRTTLYFDPLKVFVPASLALFGLSALIGLGSWWRSKLVVGAHFHDVTTVVLFVAGLQILALGALADLVTKRMK